MNEIEAVKTMIDQYTRAQDNGETSYTRCMLCDFYLYDCNRCLWAKFFSTYSCNQSRCYYWLDTNINTEIGYPSLKNGTRQSEAVREARARRIAMLKAWLKILEDENAISN
jgi:hypothetical protein